MLRAWKQVIVVVALVSAGGAWAAPGDLLTGDAKAACESLLCLGTEVRPAECNPSLAIYFAIEDENDRQRFLAKCPGGVVTLAAADASLQSYGNACSPSVLNTRTVSVPVFMCCDAVTQVCSGFSTTSTDACNTPGSVDAIDNNLPARCASVDNWNEGLIPYYVGDQLDGGHWE
jgi:hypothetical protein